MEAANLKPSPDRLITGLLEKFRSVFSELLLVLAAIGANDNRLELETDETERNTPYLALSEGVVPGESLEPVTVEQQ